MNLWLQRLCGALLERVRAKENSILDYSGLTRLYRDRLLEPYVDLGPPERMLVRFMLDIPEGVAVQRAVHRTGHFAGRDLIPSQFEILEGPELDENIVILDATRSLDELVADVEPHIERATRDGQGPPNFGVLPD